MKIGILADSHGVLKRTVQAVSLLREHGAELLLHLGDIGDPNVVQALGELPAHIVFGNCEYNTKQLEEAAKIAGVTVDHPAGRLVIDDKIIVFTHGHLESPMKQAIEEAADYLLHGHTHVARDDRLYDTRVINPGALHRATRYTVALLEPAADRVEFLEVPRS